MSFFAQWRHVFCSSKRCNFGFWFLTKKELSRDIRPSRSCDTRFDLVLVSIPPPKVSCQSNKAGTIPDSAEAVTRYETYVIYFSSESRSCIDWNTYFIEELYWNDWWWQWLSQTIAGIMFSHSEKRSWWSWFGREWWLLAISNVLEEVLALPFSSNVWGIAKRMCWCMLSILFRWIVAS